MQTAVHRPGSLHDTHFTLPNVLPVLQVTDADVIKFLRMLTFLPLEEIDAMEQAMGKPDYAPNTAQKCLAEAVTRWVCCANGARSVTSYQRGVYN